MTYNLKKKLQTITTFYIYIYKKNEVEKYFKNYVKKKRITSARTVYWFYNDVIFLFPMYVSKILTERVL